MPFLIYAIAAIGLNILTGYCGQVSLGTGGFMAVGAYACYKLMTGVSRMSSMFIHRASWSGVITAAGRACCSACRLADQGLLPGGGDAGGAVLPGLAVQQGAVVLQLFRLGPDHRARARRLRHRRDRAQHRRLGDLSVLPGLRVRAGRGSRAT